MGGGVNDRLKSVVPNAQASPGLASVLHRKSGNLNEF